MLQEVMTAPGQIEFREIEKPEPKAGEVLVRMRRIGVCGSDIHVWHGKHPFTKYPVTQGHEVSGEIAALGAGVPCGVSRACGLPRAGRRRRPGAERDGRRHHAPRLLDDFGGALAPRGIRSPLLSP